MPHSQDVKRWCIDAYVNKITWGDPGRRTPRMDSFDTWEDAKRALVARAVRNLQEADASVRRCENRLRFAEGMKPRA